MNPGSCDVTVISTNPQYLFIQIRCDASAWPRFQTKILVHVHPTSATRMKHTSESYHTKRVKPLDSDTRTCLTAAGAVRQSASDGNQKHSCLACIRVFSAHCAAEDGADRAHSRPSAQVQMCQRLHKTKKQQPVLNTVMQSHVAKFHMFPEVRQLRSTRTERHSPCKIYHAVSWQDRERYLLLCQRRPSYRPVVISLTDITEHTVPWSNPVNYWQGLVPTVYGSYMEPDREHCSRDAHLV